MKLLSLSINGSPVEGPSQVQNLTKKTTEFGTNILQLAIELALIAVVLLSVSYLIYGGIKLAISRGEKQMVQQAREQILYAIIGLIIAFLSFFILSVLGRIFNVPLIVF